MLEEYEQHFAFKLADGYSEEEIAARLGSPAELAAQFETAPQPKRRGSVALTWLWLAWADLAYGIFAVLLIAWGAVMAAYVLSFGLTAVCLIGRLDRFPPVTLPPMPYVSALLLGGNLLRYLVIFPVFDRIIRIPAEFSTLAYFLVPLIVLCNWR